MAAGERDDTGEWVLPPQARPPTLAQLEQRIDYAVAVARSSEAAALEIGAAAIDAAEQARRAADLAQGAARRAGGEPQGLSHPAAIPASDSLEGQQAPAGAPQLDRLGHFMERADRLSARLRTLGGPPV